MSKNRYTAKPAFSAMSVYGQVFGSTSLSTAKIRESAGRALFLGNNHRIYIHSSTRAIETHTAVNQRKNRVIAAKANILPRQEFRASLANDDVSSHDHLAAKSFNAETLANAVATILNTALSLLVCHDGN
jgi:hypothetical protein